LTALSAESTRVMEVRLVFDVCRVPCRRTMLGDWRRVVFTSCTWKGFGAPTTVWLWLKSSRKPLMVSLTATSEDS